ncbi:UDP-N-acetylmuramoyl-L-alanine--D-glutamate ligase [Candidatus Roizmanbacteria bacterium]|nr:UDP-N-acetylmuramoyl-L-alanine--D-glutamate ligase [Candidatus Roizmanbacteria bacterium]
MEKSPLEKVRAVLQDKRVLVVGLGRNGGGIGVAGFAARMGAQVVVTDIKTEEALKESIQKLKEYPQIVFHLGGHRGEDFEKVDLIFKGPSVPWDLPELKKAQSLGIPVEMEVSFFMLFNPSRTIGITGTRGKSTTTQMIFEMVQNAGLTAYLAGNVAQISTISLLEKVTSRDIVVMELSSFQLSDFHRKKISPDIAVFTNFYPDHLNYYKTLEDYLYDKTAIFAYQKPGNFFTANKSVETFLKDYTPPVAPHFVTKNDFPHPLDSLRGTHNQENAAVALQVAKFLRLPEEQAIQSLVHCNGLPYRQQVVAEKGTTQFINDSASTTPIALITALKTFVDKPTVLIMGGNDKGLPIDGLMESLASVQSIVVLKGDFTDKIYPELKKRFGDAVTPVFENFEEAVNESYRRAQRISSPSYVLFSPGATSFAMFQNEFHRGEEFTRLARSI